MRHPDEPPAARACHRNLALARKLVLRWLAEAHPYGSLEAYVASTLDAPADQQPIDRLCRETHNGARARLRGKPAEQVRLAVNSALRETVLRFELVLRIYVMAHELLGHETLIETIFASQLALLACDERRERLRDESHLLRLRQCRDLSALRVKELLAVQAPGPALDTPTL